MNINHLKLIFFYLLAVLCNAAQVAAVPAALEPLYLEMQELARTGLNDGHVQGESGDIGFGHNIVSPQYNTSDGFSFFEHNEFDLQSERDIVPTEAFSTLPKLGIAAGYLNSDSPTQFAEDGLNSTYGTFMQLLAFQEPTMAMVAQAVQAAASTNLANHQRDRTNELLHRKQTPEINQAIYARQDECLKEAIGGGLFDGFFQLSGTAYEQAKANCENEISLASFLEARAAVGPSSCEWGSLVMFGHLSNSLQSEVADRMRAMFGDDELCPYVLSHFNTAGYKLVTVPPEFSITQAWFDEFEDAVVNLQAILERVRTEQGAFTLTVDDLALISIRSSVKISQTLIAAIGDGLDAIEEQPQLVRWWATEKANALVDAACDQAEVALQEAVAGPASPTEHRRWRRKVDAICGPRQIMAAELTRATNIKDIFSRILIEGDKANRRFAGSIVAQAYDKNRRGVPSGNANKNNFGGMSPIQASKDPS